jgi:hypothetical protein
MSELGEVNGVVPSGLWRSPSEELMRNPMFKAIWEVIKTWDVHVPGAYSGYCNANGNHVVAIMQGLSAQGNLATVEKFAYPRSLLEINAELVRARTKFPNPNRNFVALCEELGELAKALLDCKPGDRESSVAVYKEAVQVAGMAIRVMEEGDPLSSPAYVAHLGMAL